MRNLRDIEYYMSASEFERVKKFADTLPTPCLIIRKSNIAEKYDELSKCLPFAKIYYAVKACPIDDVITLLYERGSNFDVATIYEIDQVLRLGVSPDRVSFGNTIKKEKDIEYAYKKGIRLFATDSVSDVEKIARKAPGSKVFMRILCEGGHADWPLSKKFGAHPDYIISVAHAIKDSGLIPYGISFHVGSQQRDIDQWDNAIAQTKYLFDSLKEIGIDLKMINMGGGFPASYISPTQPLSVYTREITRFLYEDFGDDMPEIIVEPGRSITAEAGTIVTEIVMISQKSLTAMDSWVYLDVGKFNGLIETMDESLKYPIFYDTDEDYPSQDIILAGPTCDSADILYEDFKYQLPNAVKTGDRLYILSTGAYTASYCSVNFNGFPPMKYYLID